MVSMVKWVSKISTLSLLTVVPVVCMVSVMKAQFEVDEILWGKVRVASLLKSKAIGELLTPILEREFGGQGGFEGLPKKERKQSSKTTRELEGYIDTPSVVKTPPVTVSDSPVGVPVDASEVPMAKCRKCFESFPVADMVAEPKSGKLFCGDCVENMRNNQ